MRCLHFVAEPLLRRLEVRPEGDVPRLYDEIRVAPAAAECDWQLFQVVVLHGRVAA